MVSDPFDFSPRANSEGLLLCRSPAGDELSFPGGAGGLPPECRRIENLQNLRLSIVSGQTLIIRKNVHIPEKR